MHADVRYERDQHARKRAEELDRYGLQLTIYAIVNFGLFLIDWLGGGGWWFFVPLLAWGIPLAVRTTVVFVLVRPTGQARAEDKFRKVMGKEIGSGTA